MRQPFGAAVGRDEDAGSHWLTNFLSPKDSLYNRRTCRIVVWFGPKLYACTLP